MKKTQTAPQPPPVEMKTETQLAANSMVSFCGPAGHRRYTAVDKAITWRCATRGLLNPAVTGQGFLLLGRHLQGASVCCLLSEKEPAERQIGSLRRLWHGAPINVWPLRESRSNPAVVHTHVYKQDAGNEKKSMSVFQSLR